MALSKRLTWADSLKGILIILVVLGHSIQNAMPSACMQNHLWNIIYSFHMPAFMAVSGFLNCNGWGYLSSRLSTVYRRINQLLIPFFIWALIRVLISPPYSISEFADIILYPDGSFWFLWVLFFISVIFYFTDWVAEKVHLKQEVAMVAMCLILAIVMVLMEFRLLGFQFLAYYFLFYVLGYYIHKYQDAIISNSSWVIGGLTLLWAMMAWLWNMHELPAFLKSIPLPQTLMQYGYRFLTAAIAVYVLFAVSPKLLNSDSRVNKPVIWFGKNSLGIYTSHLLLMPLVVKVLFNLGCGVVLTIVLSFIIATAASWVLVWLIGKNRVTARLLLGKL